MFEIIPAVDILDGKCVRLKQGRFDKKTIFYENPVEAAVFWGNQGAVRLHIVDLDGARTGTPKNLNVIRKIAESVKVPLEVGGGYRKLVDIENLISSGVSRIVLGTSAIFNPNLLANVCEKYGDQIIVSVDTKDGKVLAKGWTNVSRKTIGALAAEAIDAGVRRFIFTDINRDGMLSGPNFDAITSFAASVDVPVIASGGITKKEDVERLKTIPNVEGCIIGQALYSGSIKLSELS